MAAPPTPTSVAAAVIAYSLCSGSLLLVNKVLMHLVPSAPLVTALQCLFCVCSIGGGAFLVGTPHIGPLSTPVLRAYALYTVLFVLGIYSNMRALEVTNVDTVIVFRSAGPLLVAAGDFFFMGREAPSLRSAAAMVVVLVGCAAFVAVDAAFRVEGWRAYAWVSVYTLCIAAEMLFGKAITSRHEASLAASVLLTNAFGLVPFLAIGASTGELARGLDAALFTPHACAVLALSCVLSAGIGFSSWWARSLVSATSFTVIGTVNKVLTVLLNVLVWHRHASPLGTALLFVCLAGGAFYQQAPLRSAGYTKVAGTDEDRAREREPLRSLAEASESAAGEGEGAVDEGEGARGDGS